MDSKMEVNVEVNAEVNWAERMAQLREAEWKMHKRCLEWADELLKRLDMGEQKCGLPVIVGLAQDASKFGRLAVEGTKENPLDKQTGIAAAEELVREIQQQLVTMDARREEAPV